MTMLKRPKKYAQIVRDIVKDRAHLKFKLEDTVPDMIQRMHTHGGGAGGVVDASGRFVGLVTEREIVRKAFGSSLNLQERLDYLSDQKSSEEMTAWDVMIPNADCLHPDDTVEDALDVITYFGYRHMPVVNSRGSFSGIVDARELYQHVHAKSQDIMESKDTLLSYLMGSEPYGIGAAI